MQATQAHMFKCLESLIFACVSCVYLCGYKTCLMIRMYINKCYIKAIKVIKCLNMTRRKF